MTNADIDLILVDPNEALCREWRTAFANSRGVSIVCGRFEQLPEFDCMVSAANSFGLMDGGVDLAITRFFGAQLMQRVQTRLSVVSGSTEVIDWPAAEARQTAIGRGGAR